MGFELGKRLMTVRLISAPVLGFFLAVSCAYAEGTSVSTLIKNVTIISPDHMTGQKARDVRIQDGKIAAIENGGSIAAGKGETVLEGRGRYLIPGLIDSHVHLIMVPGIEPGSEKKQSDLI